MAKLHSQVLQAIRDHSFRVSVRKLKQQGHRRITALRLQDIQQLISEAVERVLGEKDLALDGKARAGVEKEVHEEFQRLLAEHQRVLRDHESVTKSFAELQERYSLLQHELTQQQELLEHERSRELDAETLTLSKEGLVDVGSRIREAVHLVLSSGGMDFANGTADKLRQLESRIVDVTSQILEHERLVGYERDRQDKDDRVEQLERRVTKLRKHLADTEQSLAAMAKAKGIDPGVASIYRSVQGLNLEDPTADKKKEFLKEIFDQNLALRD
ncbi:MAG: hypothetical protein RL885_11310 [Planctomycetota bacterium]